MEPKIDDDRAPDLERLTQEAERLAGGARPQDVVPARALARMRLRSASIERDRLRLDLGRCTGPLWSGRSPDGRLSASLEAAAGEVILKLATADHDLASQPVRCFLFGEPAGADVPAESLVLRFGLGEAKRWTAVARFPAPRLVGAIGAACTEVQILPVEWQDVPPWQRPLCPTSSQREAIWAFRERLQRDSSACGLFLALGIERRLALISELRANVALMRQHGERFLELDEEFHALIASPAGETEVAFTRWACRLVFEQQHGARAGGLSDDYAGVAVRETVREAVCDEHQGIIDALERAALGADPDEAFQAIQLHLHLAQERWFPGLKHQLSQENAAYFHDVGAGGGLLFASLNVFPIEWRSPACDVLLRAVASAAARGAELWYLHPGDAVQALWSRRLSRDIPTADEWKAGFENFRDLLAQAHPRAADRAFALALDHDALFAALRPDCTHGFFRQGNTGRLTERVAMRRGTTWDGIELAQGGAMSVETFQALVREAVEEQARQFGGDPESLSRRFAETWLAGPSWACLGSTGVAKEAAR